MSDALQTLIEEVVASLEPLANAGVDAGVLDTLFRVLGINDPNLVNTNLVTGLAALGQGIQDVREIVNAPEQSLETAQQALDALRNVVVAVNALGASGGTDYPELGADLLNIVITERLRHGSPLLFQLCFTLGIIRQDVLPTIMLGGNVARSSKPINRLALHKLGTLLTDPVSMIRSELPTPMLSTVANAQLTTEFLVNRVGGLLNALGIPWDYGFEPGDEPFLGDAVALAPRTIVLDVPVAIADGAEAGVCITLSSADTDDLGVVLTPFGALNVERSVGTWTIKVQLSADIGAIAFGGGKGTQFLQNVGTGEVQALVKASIPQVSGVPAMTFGSAKGTRLELGQPEASIALSASTGATDVQIGAGTGASALIISAGDGDGFLADILPADGVRASFDLGITWSRAKGLTFSGSAGLDATIATRLAVGPVTLSSIHLGVGARANGSVVADVSATVGASLGPVSATVKEFGLEATLSFPSTGGNLGAADLAFGFKGPSGVGLSIDAHGVLTGGGFLSYDARTSTYGGVMQLALHDSITLTAFGLIATAMPDGRPGYSLLVFITADGFKPIPLGFGFVLQSLGGMLGVNRTFDAEVLRAGLKADTLAKLLFPRDPVGNAPVLLQTLAAAFPVRRGGFLFGLLARITWFSPTLVTLDLALILELGARTRLLLLGRVSALLPSADNDLIRLQLDTMGVLDFDAGSLEADAVLVDSRLVHKFPVTGSAALRARWGDASNFLLAVGGVNPRFAAPAGFPVLDRVAIALCAGKNPRLVCDAYFAITANTVQFGARASLFAEAAGFSVTGDIGFDALVTLLPPHFIVDFHAAMQLKRGSTNLFKVTLDGTLEGPLPLRIAAKAKFEILWFSFTVRFTFTLADGAVAGVVAVPLEDQVLVALADAANWRTQLPPGMGHGVALRALPGAAAGQVLDPLGQMVVQQPVAPLNTNRDVETVGGAPVSGARRFVLTGQLNAQSSTPVKAAFAPARYFRMNDDEALVAPSFETHDAGLMLGDSTITYAVPALVAAPLTFEPIVVAPLASGASFSSSPSAATAAAPAAMPPVGAQPASYVLPAAALRDQRMSGAAARAPVRRVGRARFRQVSGTPAASIRPPEWAIVKVADGTVAPVASDVTTWSDYRAHLATLNRGGAQWVLVPAHEL